MWGNTIKFRTSLLGLAVAMGMLAMAMSSTVALAHAYLLRSDPADGASIGQTPKEVRLWFSEPISSQFTTADLLDVEGRAVPVAAVRVDESEGNLLVLALPPLTDGIYNVVWKTLSSADGHVTQGHLVFGVGAGTAATSSPAAEQLPSPVEVALKWLNYLALAGLVGAIAVRLWVLPAALRAAAQSEPAAMTAVDRARGRVGRLALGSAASGLVIGLAMLYWQASSVASVAGGSQIDLLRGLLLQERWGALWIVRELLLTVVSGLLVVGSGRSSRPWSVPRSARTGWFNCFAVSVLLIVLMAVQALSGHAAALGTGVEAAVAADMLHLLGAGLWVGGLMAMVAALVPEMVARQSGAGAIVRAGWRPFSLLAAISVGVLTATGLYSTGRQVASVDALITTFYGQLLLAKAGLVVVVAFVGLLNAVLVHPSLASPIGWFFRRSEGWTPIAPRRLPVLAMVELSFGILVVLLAGGLSSSTPARGPQFDPAPEFTQSAFSRTMADLMVSLEVKPNRPGPNVFTVRAASTRRPAPAEVTRVMMRFTYQGQQMGTTTAIMEKVDTGLYRLGGSYLSPAGPWKVDVVVRRKGVEDEVASFNWTVAAAAAPRPVVLSDRPLEPASTGAALVFLLVVAVAAAAVVALRRTPVNQSSAQAEARLYINDFEERSVR